MELLRKSFALTLLLFISSAAQATAIGIGDFSGSENIEDFSSLGSAPPAGPFTLGDLTFSESSSGSGGTGWRLLSCCSTPIPTDVLTDDAGISNILINFATSYLRVGLDVGFFGTSGDYDVLFFDAALNLLGTVSGSTANTSFFAGWEDASGIAAVQVIETSGDNGFVGGIDNIRFESAVSNVPAPATLALLGIGLAGIRLGRKKA